jgi:N-methylhydantoinase A/oxoprolinase/acetone carboxylase beta subunit
MSSIFYAGIDTGGTYTDAAIIDPRKRLVVASAKALTTKGNFGVGVAEALSRALELAKGQVRPGDLGIVSVSTTLATNAVVEGHGSKVGVILCGFDDAMTARTGIATAFPDVPILRIAGGHDHNGDEVCKLDGAEVRRRVSAMHEGVSAFAIASAFAVRNSAHEVAVRDIVRNVCGLPTTLSSELTSDLDAPRRTLTATLNARLIARITSLVRSVREAMEKLGIDCPLMIVKGDGSLARADDVAMRPIETILSGPAASVIGAKWLSGKDDFILSDIGGTTTDVAVLQNGMPRVAPSGAQVGGWRTLVKAIDVTTTGLGGDSEVHVGMDGSISLGPQRVVPLSLLCQRYPFVLELLKGETLESEGGSQFGRFVLLPFEAVVMQSSATLSERESQILAQVGDRPVALRSLAATSLAQRVVAGLVKKGLVQVSAFTPSDAAHVLEMQSNWSREGALLGASLSAKNRDRRAPTEESVAKFCHDVWNRVVFQSARCVIDAAMPQSARSAFLVDAVCEGKSEQGLVDVRLSPRVPVIAVGGPAPVFYPEVGKRLQCEIIDVEHAAVANAVGAAAGLVSQNAVVKVEGDGSGLFRIFDGGISHVLSSGVKALAMAEELARTRVGNLAASFGVVSPSITVAIEKHRLPDAMDDEGLISATIDAHATMEPVAR